MRRFIYFLCVQEACQVQTARRRRNCQQPNSGNNTDVGDLLSCTDELKKSIGLGDIVDASISNEADDEASTIVVLDTAVKYGHVRLKAESEGEALRVLERIREAVAAFQIALYNLKRAHACLARSGRENVGHATVLLARSEMGQLSAFNEGIVDIMSNGATCVSFTAWDISSLKMFVSCPLGVIRITVPESDVSAIVDGKSLSVDGQWVDCEDAVERNMVYRFTFAVSARYHFFTSPGCSEHLQSHLPFFIMQPSI